MVKGTVHSSNVLARTFTVTDAARQEVLLHFVEEYGQIACIIPVCDAIFALISSEKDKDKQKELIVFLCTSILVCLDDPVSTMDNLFYIEILNAIVAKGAELGYSIVLSNSGSENEREHFCKIFPSIMQME